MPSNTIAHWPSADVPRDKLVHHGAGSLCDAELLSLFIRSTRKGPSPVDIARDALGSLGGITGLLGADRRLVASQDGLTDLHWIQLQASQELARRHVFAAVADRDVLSSPEQVRRYLSLHLTGLSHEVFAALFLDNRHRVIEYRELFRGTIDCAAVYPREVVKRCLSSNAAAVIFAHNHPSGLAEPSDTDVRLTPKLLDALKLINVRVLDHMIVGQGTVTSLAERGLM